MSKMSTLNNSVRLTGFLGSAPEIKVTENQKKVAKLNLATNNYRKNKDGERVTETTWHQIVLWKNRPSWQNSFWTKAARFP